MVSDENELRVIPDSSKEGIFIAAGEDTALYVLAGGNYVYLILS